MAKKVEEKKELNINEQLIEKRKELVEAKRGLHTNELQNPHAIKKIKKDIARLMTKINAEKTAEKKGE